MAPSRSIGQRLGALAHESVTAHALVDEGCLVVALGGFGDPPRRKAAVPLDGSCEERGQMLGGQLPAARHRSRASLSVEGRWRRKNDHFDVLSTVDRC